MTDLTTPLPATPAVAERSQQPSGSTATEGARIGDVDAWAIVATPLVAGLLDVILRAVGIGGSTSENLVELGYGVSLLYFGFHDAMKINRGGGNSEHVWLTWWALVTPIYLIQRARALRRGWLFLALFVLTVAVDIAITTPSVLSSTTYWGSGIPTCDEVYSRNMVKSVLDDAVKTVGATTTSIDLARETKFEDKIRSCSAVAKFSDGSTRPIHYTVTEEGHQFMFRVWGD